MKKRKTLCELSVDEFMEKGFSSDDEFEDLQLSTEEKSQNQKNIKLKLSQKKSKIKKVKKNTKQEIDVLNDDAEESSFTKMKRKKIHKDKINKSLSKKKKLTKEVINEEAFEESDEALENKDEIFQENDIVDEERKNLQEDDDSSESDEESLGFEMGKLKEKDPEFYKFLEENDKELLNFDVSDGEDFEDDGEKMETEDFDDEEDDSIADKKINKKLLEQWKTELKEKHDANTIRKVISGFKAAVQQASGEEMTDYKIDDDAAFNQIIYLCLTELVPALHKFLKLPNPVMSKNENQVNPTKCKNWKKISSSVKSYLNDIIKLSATVSEPAIVTTMLKHILYLIPFYLSFVKMSRILIKKLIKFWSTGEETARILCFLCIIRTVRSLSSDYLDYTLKQMYMDYVKNCKFTSKTLWPSINFMKRSLVELYSLNLSVAYQHGFVFIRQLSIHLRNAVTIKKKETIQTVYNWQYIHCLLFWMRLLSTLNQNDSLKSLIYPLVQTTIGTINLIPTPKYIPLRFHLIKGLMLLSKDTDTFIPVLPFIYETLNIVDFKKKHTSLSMKPMEFDCALKLSKSQLQENGFKDKVVELVYESMLEYLQSQSHTIGFPELVLPTVVHIKSFLKTCKISNYSRKLKQLIDKIQENSTEITNRRKSVTFKLSDSDAIKQWERELKERGTPLVKFYESWKKAQQSVIIENEDS
ncbi:nucleolar complex protein 2 homolog [Centruroides vittatus]|uniref:nucleolar complex protein 2 homolog n=1 Tax=Centruroides vittatus TaxID=120091 RepID=UPI00350F34E8